MAELINGIASGLNALLEEYNTVSHNIANSNTTGFKKRYTSFSTQLRDIQNANFSPLNASIDSTDTIDFSPGQVVKTGRRLDVALEGKGFLELETPTGRLYTRNGSLQINILGQLTDLNGHLVAGKSGPITVPRSISDGDLSISETGLIAAGEKTLGQLRIAEFENPAQQLESAGNGCFRGLNDVEPQSAENTSILQGYRESSNVQAVQELTNLMVIGRMFEANTDFLKKQAESSQAILGVANS